jgi:uncharacterized RDD family membrane protein YckC
VTRVRLWRRLAAAAYDLLLVLGLLMVLTAFVIVARGGAAVGAGALWFQGLLLVCWWLYFAWSWTHGGQTVGMRVWRLQLLAEQNGRVSWTQATLRFLTAWLSTLALGLGFARTVLARDKRSWHGRLSRTRLVHLGPSTQA